MKKKIRIFFEPVEMEIDIYDGLSKETIEAIINNKVYDFKSEEEICNQASIEYWEEI
jgi:hypothetical protein